MINVKIKNNFVVGDFMKNIDVDFIFAYNEDEDEYLVMNDSLIGKFDKANIEAFVDGGKRVVVINSKELQMTAYNIDEYELSEAFLNMK